MSISSVDLLSHTAATKASDKEGLLATYCESADEHHPELLAGTVHKMEGTTRTEGADKENGKGVSEMKVRNSADDPFHENDNSRNVDEQTKTKKWREKCTTAPPGVSMVKKNPRADETLGGRLGERADSDTKKKSKNPLRFLKRLTTSKPDTYSSQPVENLEGDLTNVTVDGLPQTFSTKYLGARKCSALWGIKHTRRPVQELVESASKQQRGDDVPLVHMEVSKSGINVEPHPKNRGKKFEPGLIPIEFISYGVQDVQFSRIFAFIVVKEMSSESRKMECHAYVCDSPTTARKIALSVALAFEEYARSLKGQPHRFKVDLLPKEETKEEPSKEEEEECDV